jgi:DNA-binding NarL/FixJ family response regulator
MSRRHPAIDSSRNNVTAADGERPPLSAIIVAAVRLYRQGLVDALDGMDGVRICGGCADVGSATAMIDECRPDVAIVDMEIPGAFALIADTRARVPSTHFIAFGIDEDIQTILDCAKAGAAGYVTANASLDELVTAMRRAVDGELLCTPRVAAELFRRIGETVGRQPEEPAGDSTPLTIREVQVFGCVQRGLSNKEIATTLNIAESTVKNHVHKLLEKLRVDTRAQAVARATLNSPRPMLTSSRRKSG